MMIVAADQSKNPYLPHPVDERKLCEMQKQGIFR